MCNERMLRHSRTTTYTYCRYRFAEISDTTLIIETEVRCGVNEDLENAVKRNKEKHKNFYDIQNSMVSADFGSWVCRWKWWQIKRLESSWWSSSRALT